MSNKSLSFFEFEKEDRPEIIEVRHRFFNWIIYPFLIFGFLSAVLGSLQTYQQGMWVFSIFYAGCYMIFVLTVLAGRRIS
jgi:ACR3 family arsenite efflux pump ArsB